MHTSLKWILTTLLVSSPLMVSAADEKNPEQTPTTSAQTSEAATPVQSKAMAEQMQKMQTAHDKVAAAKTPAERQAAMQESIETMKDSMTLMHKNCHGMGMGMSSNKDGMGMGMMDMMMKMMDQQSSMMKMPMSE